MKSSRPFAKRLFDDNGFTLCDTPILTPAACEGTTTLFEVKYFEEMAYLTQSGQLYSEATAAALGRVYNFGPTFRAEKSKTRRHLTEFWMVEPEGRLRHGRRHHGSCRADDFVRGSARHRKTRGGIESSGARYRKTRKGIVPPFPRISYDDAIGILQKNESAIQWGSDFGGGDETIISQQFDKPVMVHHYPTAIKAFYMEPDPNRYGCRALPGCAEAGRLPAEIVGGGQLACPVTTCWSSA